MAEMDKITSRVLKLAQQGYIACSQALQLANELNISPMLVGRAANNAGIKITGCQLGCFGIPKER